MQQPDARDALGEGGATSPEAAFSLRGIAVPAYGPTILAAVGTGAVTPVVALTAIDLGASPSVAALTVGLALIAELFFAVPAGAVVHRIGERRALTWACAVDAVGCLAAFFAGSLAVLMVAVFALGFTGSVFLVARQAYLIDAVPFGMRARALSTLGGVHRIGMVVGPFVGVPVIHLAGPRGGFAVAAAAGVAAAALVWGSRDLTAEHEAATATEQPSRTLDVLRAHRRTYLTLGLGIMVIGGARSARVVLVPLWAAHLGLSAVATSVIVGIAAAIEVALFYPAGSVMDRYGRTWVALPCVGLLAAAALLLPLTSSTTTVLLVAVVGAVGNGLGSGIVMTLGADSAPERGRSQFLGGWRFVSVLGGSGAPALISLVTAGPGLAAACVTMGCLTLLGSGWLGYWVPRFDPRRASLGK